MCKIRNPVLSPIQLFGNAPAPPEYPISSSVSAFSTATTSLEESGKDSSISTVSELWTCDNQGEICIWSIPNFKSDERLLALVHRIPAPRFPFKATNMIEAPENQVWIGSLEGDIRAWDIISRTPLPDPLPSHYSHANLCAITGLFSTCSLEGQTAPKVVYSASRDQSILRFCF